MTYEDYINSKLINYSNNEYELHFNGLIDNGIDAVITDTEKPLYAVLTDELAQRVTDNECGTLTATIHPVYEFEAIPEFVPHLGMTFRAKLGKLVGYIITEDQEIDNNKIAVGTKLDLGDYSATRIR